MKKITYKKNQGFGLIELLVSVAIFTIVAVMGITALLSIIDEGEKAQSLNSVMQNLNIALETMTRNIRTGSNYTCPTLTYSVCDGSGVTSFTFVPAGADTSNTVTYSLSGTRITALNLPVAAGLSLPQNITAEEVSIDDLRFYVSNTGTNSTAQPRVVMSLVGHVQTRAKNKVTFTLQTTMTQRVLGQDEQ